MSVSQNSKILASDCVSTATASTLVLRDSNGDFASRNVSFKTLNIQDPGNVNVGQMTCETQGTTSVEGLCTLTLGNSSGKTTGGNATGKIKIYNGASNGFVNIYGEYSDNRSQIEVGGYLSVLNGIYLKDSDKTIIGSLTCSIKGTTATHGYCRLILGNTKNSGTAGNSSGEIWLYAPHNANTSQSVISYDSIRLQGYNKTNDSILAKFCAAYDTTAGAGLALYLSASPSDGSTIEGSARLTLGNSTASNTLNGMRGIIQLYSTGTNYCTISARDSGVSGVETGASFTRTTYFASTCTSYADYRDAAIQIREHNYVTKDGQGGWHSGPGNWGSAPRIGFHWAGLVGASIGLAENGYLYEQPYGAASGTYYQISLVGASSRIIKNYIKPLPDMGEQIDQLNPVSFIYKNRASQGIRYGLIHEDTVGIIPDVCKFDQYTDGGRYINYEDLVPVLIKEVQSLRKRVKQLEDNSSPQIEDEL